MRIAPATFSIAAIIAVLTACGGGVHGVVNNAVCTVIPIKNSAIPLLIYPIPGNGAVPNNAPAMVVAYTGDPAIAGILSIQPPGGAPLALGPMGAAPKVMPTPHASPPAGSGSLYGVTLPTMQAHTHYTVSYRYLTSVSVCGTQTSSTVSLGAFATQ